MNTQLTIRRMAGTAILLALSIIFGFIGNYIQIGPVSFNLTLIPISLGAILYGPSIGVFLGLVNGVIVLQSPSTAMFLSYYMFGTIFIVLLKTSLAGLVSGLIFKFLKNKNKNLGIILSCVITPIINTLIFGLGCFTFFNGLLFEGQSNAFLYFCLTIVGWNFVFELGASSLLSPTIIYIVNILSSKFYLGIK